MNLFFFKALLRIFSSWIFPLKKFSSVKNFRFRNFLQGSFFNMLAFILPKANLCVQIDIRTVGRHQRNAIIVALRNQFWESCRRNCLFNQKNILSKYQYQFIQKVSLCSMTVYYIWICFANFYISFVLHLIYILCFLSKFSLIFFFCKSTHNFVSPVFRLFLSVFFVKSVTISHSIFIPISIIRSKYLHLQL